MLIDLTYFKGSLFLAQLGQPDISERVEDFIEEFEREYLQKCVGLALAEELLAYDGDPINPDFEALLEGTNYEKDGDLLHFEGLKKGLAYYVYFQYVIDQYSTRAGVGEVIPLTENSEVIVPQRKRAIAWNNAANIANQVPFLDLDIENYVRQEPFEKTNRFDI
jgi:hypothetical protein